MYTAAFSLSYGGNNRDLPDIPGDSQASGIPETYEYLKKIYKHQKPSIVLIDGNNLFRDKTDIDNLDSITKAKLATIFPVISFHKNLNPRRLKNIFGNQHSVMKGYYYRKASHKVHKKKHRMKFTRKCWQINKLSASTFFQVYSLLQKPGFYSCSDFRSKL